MASIHQQDVATRYWGYLIQPDKSPAPPLRQLLLAIASYICEHVAPWETTVLTPNKLAQYYRTLGGNCDSLFLQYPNSTLSTVYRRLGCFHTLQPSKDPYAAPSIPALTREGFVRWQTLQLLLDPGVHTPFLQESVRRFDLVNSLDGEAFPCILPCSALPPRPDPEMLAWHRSISDRLRKESEGLRERVLQSNPTMAALSDIEESSRPTSADSLSIESQSLIDAASFFQRPNLPRSASAYAPSRRNTTSDSMRAASSSRLPSYQAQSSRRNSYNGAQLAQSNPYVPSAPSQGPNGTSVPPDHFKPRHTQARWTLSCSSDSSSSTSSSSSESLHQRYSFQSARNTSQSGSSTKRRSAHPLHRPSSHPNVSTSQSQRPLHSPSPLRQRFEASKNPWQDQAGKREQLPFTQNQRAPALGNPAREPPQSLNRASTVKSGKRSKYDKYMGKTRRGSR